MRNVKKQARIGLNQLRRCDELQLTELGQIYEIARHPKHDVLFDVIGVCYHMGYAAGIRAEQQRSRSRR